MGQRAGSSGGEGGKELAAGGREGLTPATVPVLGYCFCSCEQPPLAEPSRPAARAAFCCSWQALPWQAAWATARQQPSSPSASCQRIGKGQSLRESVREGGSTDQSVFDNGSGKESRS